MLPKTRIGIILTTALLICIIAGICTTPSAEETVLLPSSNVEFVGDGPAITSGPQKGYENRRDELHEKWFVDVLGSDWTEYKNGSMHMRAVVTELTKPVQLAFFTFWDGKRGHHGVGTRCPRSGKLSGTGTFTGYRDSDEFWASDPIHWDRMGGEWRIQLRDGNSLQFKSDSEIKKYYPLKFNLTVVFVKSGGTFSGWENHKIEGVGSVGTASTGMQTKAAQYIVVSNGATIELRMPDNASAHNAALSLFSINGALIQTMESGQSSANSIVWDLNPLSGNRINAGMYVYRIDFGAGNDHMSRNGMIAIRK